MSQSTADDTRRQKSIEISSSGDNRNWIHLSVSLLTRKNLGVVAGHYLYGLLPVPFSVHVMKLNTDCATPSNKYLI